MNRVQASPLRALSVLTLICALLPVNFAFAETGIEADSGGPYTYGRASRDGIGKFYMGREISHVMGHLGAEWLERSSRRCEERTDRLVARRPLEP